MKNYITILLVLLSTLLYSQNSEIDWKADIEFLKNELPKKHKDFFTVRTYNDFDDELNEIVSKLNRLEDFEIILSIQQVIASFGDSHTHIEFSKLFDQEKSLPLKLYWFKNGLHILATSQKNKLILGKKITSINDYPIAQICDSLETLFTVDNSAMSKMFVPKLLNNGALLEFFGFAKNGVYELGLEDDNASFSKSTVQIERITKENQQALIPNTKPYCLQHQRDVFIQNYIEKDSIYYIQYNKCASRELMIKFGHPEKAKKYPSFTEFENKIFHTIKEQPIKQFVFDMRFNGGGSSAQGTEFVKKISQIKEINSKGKLYVVIGRKTFSSAIINAIDFKNQTEVILVGEETSGKPNHFGEIRSFDLPHSKLNVTYSTKYFKETDEDINTIVPDICIETSFEDYMNGVDPVYEWIK
uniref:S41 family peptidase n=1 Tax=Ancylomarina sp. TaxID=1970196 RepID=UPI003565AF30